MTAGRLDVEVPDVTKLEWYTFIVQSNIELNSLGYQRLLGQEPEFISGILDAVIAEQF